jgi:hypothetical protein
MLYRVEQDDGILSVMTRQQWVNPGL